MNKCVFCDIANRSISSKVVKENEDFIAIVPKEIEVDGHLIVFPKVHCETLLDIDAETLQRLTSFVQEICSCNLQAVKKRCWFEEIKITYTFFKLTYSQMEKN